MSEIGDFRDWQKQLAELPEKPDEGEDAISYAQRLQAHIAMYPRAEQELVAGDCIDLLKQNYSYEFYGLHIAVHALRALVYDPYAKLRSIPPDIEFNSPVNVEGFCDKFTPRPHIREVVIGLEISHPSVRDYDGLTILEIPKPAPVTVPVIQIWAHTTI